jgi:hypothetical protein
MSDGRVRKAVQDGAVSAGVRLELAMSRLAPPERRTLGHKTDRPRPPESRPRENDQRGPRLRTGAEKEGRQGVSETTEATQARPRVDDRHPA